MTAVVTTHRATQEQGPPIINGQLVWTSATGITAADPQSFGGCNRRWYYDTVLGLKGPPTKAMLGGTGLHTEIENRLLKGASLQSRLALAGGIYIPHPGSGLYVEKPIAFDTRVGVKIYGHVDLYNLRQEYIDVDGELQQDLPWSFEVKDWKTTSDFKYAKSEHELAHNIQLVTYAEAGFRMWPDFEHARLTHVYFRTKGTPDSRLVTIRRSREEIGARWEYAESVVRVMADVAKATNENHVDANTKSCSAYNGCPHASRCSAFRSTSLDSVYGKIADDFKGATPVGLLTQNNVFQNQPQPTAAPAQNIQAQLQAEEAQMRAQVAQQQQQMPNAGPSPQQLLEVCQRLGTYGYGFPSLGGNAAQAYAAAGGQAVAPGFQYQGIPAPAGARRSLHGIMLSEVGHIFQLEGELARERGADTLVQMVQQPPPAGTQLVQPVQYAPQTFTQQVAQAYNTIAQTPQPVVSGPQMSMPGILPPGAPESQPALAQAQPEPVNVVPSEQPAAAPTKKKGRPAKVQETAPEVATSTSVAQTAATAPAPAPSTPAPVATQVTPVAASTSTAQVIILVNARVSGLPSKTLAAYVDHINAELSKRYSVHADGTPGIQDVRCAPKDSPLAFGGWKGAVREVIKTGVGLEGLEGAYHLDTFMDELNEAVADALRVVADQRGWIYVRGVR